MATIKPYKVGSMAPGVNNRLPATQMETSVARSRATYLRAGENIDITGAGTVKRRRGTTRRIDGAFVHSLWGDGDEGFAVSGADLLRLAPAANGVGLVSTVMRGDMSPQLPVSYTRCPDGDVYYTNGLVLGRIAAGQARPVVTAPLAVPPTVARIAGALPAGRYLLAFTRLTVDGESASTVPMQMEVPEDSGFALSGLTADTQIYMSGPNGDILTRVDAAAGQIFSLSDGGRRCATLLLASMPAGSIVRYYNASLLVATGNLLRVSEPYYYGLHNPAKSFIPFPAPITVVEPCEGGVYVCADQTYWLAGKLFDAQVAKRLPYGAVAGSGGFSADTKQVFWISDRGLVVGDTQGVVKNVQEDALKLAGGSAGATLFREQDGMNHIVTARAGANTSTAVASSYMDAEFIRKGTIL